MIRSIKKKLIDNKGSAMVIMLLAIVILSSIGLAVMMLSFSDFTMSALFRDTDKAYNAAEAAQGMAALALDQKVMELQESARTETSQYIQSLLEPADTSPLRTPDGSIDTAAVEALFKVKYLEYFRSGLNDPGGFFANIGSQDNMKLLIGAAPADAKAAKTIDDGCQARIESASLAGDVVTINTAGIFTDSRHDTITRKISASYNLMPTPDKIAYRVIPEVSVVKTSTPAVLSKALLTEKNVISAGGVVNITGDVLAFGTVPAKNNDEDPDAPWYRYGGIVAGLPNMQDIGSYLGFDTGRTGLGTVGKINIDGDAATMAYVHTMFGSDNTNFSSISSQGQTFARSVKTEEPANYSRISLHDVYTTDNLQLDSSESVVDILGKYHGMVTAGYDIDGSGTNSGASEYRFKKTSSIVVNGDSTLNLNGTAGGGLFIGGSTFLKNYADSAYYPGEYRPYMTGISALRSSGRLAEAFKEYNAKDGETRLYTGSDQYVAGNGITYSNYADISDPNNIVTDRMLNGTDGEFSMTERSAHFKWLWEGLWKLDQIYQRYINPSSIQISTDPDQKIQGYSYGAVAANGKVYGQQDYKGSIDASNFGLMQKGGAGSVGWLEEFHNQLKPLLIEDYSYMFPRLDYTVNSKYIADYVDQDSATVFSVPTAVAVNGDQAGFVYYRTGDCIISSNGTDWVADGHVLPDSRGIILAEGNIYVPDGFNFTGSLLTAKSIVFLGDSNIVYDADLMNSMLMDPSVAGLFKVTRFTAGEDAIKAQRVSYKNIKLVDWKKID